MEMERLHLDRGQAAFTLTQRLQRQRVNHPDDFLSLPNAATDIEEIVEWFEVDREAGVGMFNAPNPGSVGVTGENEARSTLPGDEAGIVPCDSKAPTGNRKIKALFGRRRTHNEQTLVRPCGVIVARATFFGAEAVSNVLVCIMS
jgi:hypothetical protein